MALICTFLVTNDVEPFLHMDAGNVYILAMQIFFGKLSIQIFCSILKLDYLSFFVDRFKKIFWTVNPYPVYNT